MPVWKVLNRTTPQVSPKTIPNIRLGIAVKNLQLQYDEKQELMTFTGDIHSAKDLHFYQIIVVFKDVKRNTGLSSIELEKGLQPKPFLNDNEVMIRCSCPSYRFRFDQYNRVHDFGTGPRFGYYHRLTSRKPNNPKHLPGFCKHVAEFVNYLKANGFIH